MKIDFLPALKIRALEIEREFLIAQRAEINILVSGGSASSLMLHIFADLQASKILQLPVRAVYLQLNNFIWLEREAARSLAASLQIPFEEVVISEIDLIKSEIWKNSTTATREELIWHHLDDNLADRMISGRGWPQFIRLHTELAVPGTEILAPEIFLKNVIEFYKPELWQAFLAESSTQLFFDLWGQIPFQSIRYWQDYVFKKNIPTFQPCLDWKFKNIL